MNGIDEIRTPAEDDASLQAAVLGQLLSLNPARASFDELLREFAVGSDDFAGRDALERAIRDLAAAGLLHRSGALIVPSRAAIRFDELLR